MIKVQKDLTGQKFGRLTVIKQVEDYITKSNYHKAQWLCQCDCGNVVEVVGSCLLQKHGTRSCGCIRRETTYKRGKSNKKYNTYDLSGEYGIGYTLKNETFIFDKEDYDLIKNYCWRLDHDGYIESDYKENSQSKKECIKLHRLVMNCPSGMVVDHINHNVSDNRKSNLRICTYGQNNMNVVVKTSSSSGVTGVCLNKNKTRWLASITVDNHRYRLGSFVNFEDAVQARKEAEEKYYGEYSYANSQKVCV